MANLWLRRDSILTSTAIVIAAAIPLAQSRVPDLSGRWRLVEPAASERLADTLSITAPDEIQITHTPREITIAHPSKAGTHPEAGTFQYGSGGFVGGVPGGSGVSRGTWGVTHIGTQLMISKTTTYPPDERGVQATVTTGSMWRLDAPNRLIIEFGEERVKERPKIATRAYTKVGP